MSYSLHIKKYDYLVDNFVFVARDTKRRVKTAWFERNKMNFVHGDIFTSKLNHIVCPTNVRSVMGGGLALQFRNRYPQLFANYVRDCQRGLCHPGGINLYPGYDNRTIICFHTKDDFRQDSRLEWIDSGLYKIRNLLMNNINASLAIPPVGAGLGGLNPNDVKALIIKQLSDLPNTIEVYNL